jgi:flagellar protein FliS
MRNSSQAAQMYSQMGRQGKAEDASPHRLITMLFDGALERINAARGAMGRNNISAKGALISRAITIIDGLRASLDMEKGGQISVNLRDLYDYMEAKLFEANLQNSPEMLDEVAALLRTVREGWVGIEEQITNLPETQSSE